MKLKLKKIAMKKNLAEFTGTFWARLWWLWQDTIGSIIS
jgi:hypothetical protein